jgi:hypothetical protein
MDEAHKRSDNDKYVDPGYRRAKAYDPRRK